MVEPPVAQTGFMLLHLRRVPELALLAGRNIHTETKRRTRDKAENAKFNFCADAEVLLETYSSALIENPQMHRM